MGQFTIASELAADPGTLWRHAVSPVGVNREFRPFLRMTFPPGIADITADSNPGERCFRSWILFAGFLPVEYDDLVFEEIDPGRRFLERSSMFLQRLWEHERIIEPTPGGCRVSDRVRFEPRLPLLDPICTPIYRAVFTWRHRNLRIAFGEAQA